MADEKPSKDDEEAFFQLRVRDVIREQAIKLPVKQTSNGAYLAWRLDDPEAYGVGKTSREAVRGAQVAALRRIADRLEKNVGLDGKPWGPLEHMQINILTGIVC